MKITAEKVWVSRFKKCLNEMPKSIEVLVSSSGAIVFAKRGSSAQYFKEHGDVDNVPIIPEHGVWNGTGVENNGSSL